MLQREGDVAIQLVQHRPHRTEQLRVGHAGVLLLRALDLQPVSIQVLSFTAWVLDCSTPMQGSPRVVIAAYFVIWGLFACHGGSPWALEPQTYRRTRAGR